jgi:hypothetical protein
MTVGWSVVYSDRPTKSPNRVLKLDCGEASPQTVALLPRRPVCCQKWTRKSKSLLANKSLFPCDSPPPSPLPLPLGCASADFDQIHPDLDRFRRPLLVRMLQLSRLHMRFQLLCSDWCYAVCTTFSFPCKSSPIVSYGDRDAAVRPLCCGFRRCVPAIYWRTALNSSS